MIWKSVRLYDWTLLLPLMGYIIQVRRSVVENGGVLFTSLQKLTYGHRLHG